MIDKLKEEWEKHKSSKIEENSEEKIDNETQRFEIIMQKMVEGKALTTVEQLALDKIQNKPKDNSLIEKTAKMLIEDLDKYGRVDEDGNIIIDSGLQKQKIGKITKQEEYKPEVELPKTGKLISNFAEELMKIISKKKELFYRIDSKSIVEIH